MFSMNEQKAIELGESGERAVREQNEYDALQYIDYLREFGEELLNADLEKDLKRVVISIRNIGNKAVQNRMDNVAYTALSELKILSEPALDKNFSNAMWSFSKAIQEIGKGAVQFQMLEPAQIAIDALKMIGLGAVEKRMEVVTLWTTLALEEIAYLAKRQQLEDFSKAAMDAREEIIEASELANFKTREEIEKYPQLIAQTVSQYSELQNLQPAGYAAKPNEEFTEEEFFEDEGDTGEQEPETEAAKKEK
ncbi:hypothetical protein SAMN02910340_01772 [Methanosarcina thermophila]|jgi:hypothetical protein|uniref:Uncharacterized protein n=3 Tax=Methanosarcina thermophila TaxID=2210 RepID=A0A1I6ZYG9_METTE|nr:hypothetical protein [Methanosarcina thermophila]ALK06129.1 MAG: hypothetical protein AAY43_11060 [Methanosarcina sp. 795]AKB12264.1 hypothetical protein MSTHT_0506 [Methanosarcina thermophila TM-1]AKB14533.1 hypothetical protein MSTHC_0215 [Methanosarcina thermophila CHTI-55]NLU56450.1 hypothetical protein [Methanosarcina thermophila]SFT67722.1 hypothetical protein SAMN02910340_01772 [Methanosarcina thermophila]